MKNVIFLLAFLFFFSFQVCHMLKMKSFGTEYKGFMFFQIDRDMNEPPYYVINVHYTESNLSENLLNKINNNRNVEKHKTQNYFRKNLIRNKYFINYAKRQKEQLETLIDLS
ncbi:LIMP protein, putative [Hepatocystis sp. ex Piliocolobus tephrosceles]|nr:LIMP protein, putative [Hepatocystis sp. ex Piliocolobus tephrosceles]